MKHGLFKVYKHLYKQVYNLIIQTKEINSYWTPLDDIHYREQHEISEQIDVRRAAGYRSARKLFRRKEFDA